MPKKLCIGIPVYNGSAYIRQALDSLLAQTYADFHIVVLDDGSTDDSYSILEQYAKLDSRISLFRNTSRTGLIAAWNRVAKLCGELFEPTYFAWFSDHDWVDSHWLDELYRTLENNPDTALAHSRTTIVDAHGGATSDEGFPLDTASMPPLNALRAVTLDFFGAGDAVYGLFRYDILARIGFLPQEILPDRLVISEACLFGDIRHVPSARRYRRNLSPENYSDVIVDKQLQTLFAGQDKRLRAPLLRHATYLLRRFMESPVEEMVLNVRIQRLIHAYLYLVRQYNRYESKWEDEIEEARLCDELSPYLLLFTFIAHGKWIPLTRDADLRLREFKSLCDDLRQGLADTKENLSEQIARREEAELRLSEFKSLCDELRQGFADVREKLTEQTARREEAESRLIEFKSLCNNLRQGLDDQTSKYEKVERHVVALESQNDELRHRIELDAFTIASLREANARLSMQLNSLEERVKRPYHLVRHHLLGQIRKAIGR